MAITQRTVEEAKTYITESLKQWEEANESKKIISLAAFAEKWRSKTGIRYAKMREMQKNISALKLIIKRLVKINPKSPIIALESELATQQKTYDAYVAKFGEPKPKIKKVKVELPKTE
ncbi:MAG: hypothetical protein NT092_10755 [Bacteroidia bacterium]|nr:hypothetical protein [Bacteroidia bacterium]